MLLNRNLGSCFRIESALFCAISVTETGCVGKYTVAEIFLKWPIRDLSIYKIFHYLESLNIFNFWIYEIIDSSKNMSSDGQASDDVPCNRVLEMKLIIVVNTTSVLTLLR